MKKNLFFAASALLALASCTTSDEVFEGIDLQEQAKADNAITFSTYMGGSTQTRNGYVGGIDTDILKNTEKANGFGVFAYYTGNQGYSAATNYAVTTTGATGQTTVKPNFMYNEHVYYDESSTTDYVTHWKYDIMKYWPNEVGTTVDDQTDPATSTNANGGNLSFFAYAPYVSSFSGDDGIVGITTSATASDPILTYKVATDGKNVVDLLWGTFGAASAGVAGAANTGVTYESEGSNYQKSILPTYTLNADLTKQKTQGKVNFAFKHALAKVGGSENSGASVRHGLMIDLLIDDQKGEETGGSKDATTKVTVKSINIVAKSRNATTGDDAYYQTSPMTGTFNLATGQWSVTNTTGTSASAATTTHLINQDGTSAAGALNTTIVEPTSWNATWASNPEGVTTTPKNVYATETAPLVLIPGTFPELTVTVDYFVRTEDSKLDGGYSQVEQVITKTITFASAVELNKQYNLLIHLGLTSVKFEATVSDWTRDTTDETSTPDGVADHREEVHVPINVK